MKKRTKFRTSQFRGYVLDEGTRKLVFPFPVETKPYIQYDAFYGKFYRCVQRTWIERGSQTGKPLRFRVMQMTSKIEWNRLMKARVMEYGRQATVEWIKGLDERLVFKYNRVKRSTLHDFCWLETVKGRRNAGSELFPIPLEHTFVFVRFLETYDSPTRFRSLRQAFDATGYEFSEIPPVERMALHQMETNSRRMNPRDWLGIEPVFMETYK